ncbi:MAG: heavy metal-binding domain-containing protein [Bdellovibrionaceae bacterium]|nr:heavy metal-binding domain-containing protein [Pseudobdellovibrionaceae bacterium]
MELIIQLGFVAFLLAIGYFFGSAREQSHYKSIIQRQKSMSHLPTRAEKIKDTSPYSEAMLVSGSVVIASDYFKNFVAGIKGFFGGRLTTYETLMDRGRRESILRMKEQALKWGADEILEVRLEMATLDAIGIEMFAYGTAVKKHKV